MVSITLFVGEVNHVTTFVTAAIMIQRAQLGLERSGCQGLDVKALLLCLIGTARIVHI